MRAHFPKNHILKKSVFGLVRGRTFVKIGSNGFILKLGMPDSFFEAKMANEDQIGLIKASIYVYIYIYTMAV